MEHVMGLHAPDKTPSPRVFGAIRKHSPWTAGRQRKKNRQGDLSLPLYPSDDENSSSVPGSVAVAHLDDLNTTMECMNVDGVHTALPPQGTESAFSTHQTQPDFKLFWPGNFGLQGDGEVVKLTPRAASSCKDNVKLDLVKCASETAGQQSHQQQQPSHLGHAASWVEGGHAHAGTRMPHYAFGKSADLSLNREVLRPLPVNSLSAEGLQMAGSLKDGFANLASSGQASPSDGQQSAPPASLSSDPPSSTQPVNEDSEPSPSLSLHPDTCNDADAMLTPCKIGQGRATDDLVFNTHPTPASLDYTPSPMGPVRQPYVNDEQDCNTPEAEHSRDDGSTQQYQQGTEEEEEEEEEFVIQSSLPSGSPSPSEAGRSPFLPGAMTSGATPVGAKVQSRYRRKPTPAGHLLGRCFNDDDDEDEDSAGAGKADGRCDMAEQSPYDYSQFSQELHCAGHNHDTAGHVAMRESEDGAFKPGQGSMAQPSAGAGAQGIPRYRYSDEGYARGHRGRSSAGGHDLMDAYMGGLLGIGMEHEFEGFGTDGLAEDGFCTPPHSPGGTLHHGGHLTMDQFTAAAEQLVRWRKYRAAKLAAEAAGGAPCGKYACGDLPERDEEIEFEWEDPEEPQGCPIPVEQLATLEEFNAQLSQAAQSGNRGRATVLWQEICDRGLQPDLRTLNMLVRCLCKSLAHPDEAEHLAREVCQMGNFSPNATTYNLLAETRLRFEQVCGL